MNWRKELKELARGVFTVFAIITMCAVGLKYGFWLMRTLEVCQ